MSKTERHRQSRSKRRKQQLDTTKAEDDSLSETDLERAISFHQAGELDLASQIYHAIIAADSRNADAHHLLGMITNQLGDNKTAINLINRAIDLNPAQSSFYNNLGKILKEEGQLDQAIQAYQATIEINPRDVIAYNKAIYYENRKGQRKLFRLTIWLLELMRAIRKLIIIWVIY